MYILQREMGSGIYRNEINRQAPTTHAPTHIGIRRLDRGCQEHEIVFGNAIILWLNFYMTVGGGGGGGHCYDTDVMVVLRTKCHFCSLITLQQADPGELSNRCERRLLLRFISYWVWQWSSFCLFAVYKHDLSTR